MQMFRHRRGCEFFLSVVFVFTYDQDVVELLHSVDLRQQLVDHRVVNARAARHAATLLTDRINLIKYDDVKTAVGSELFNGDGEN